MKALAAVLRAASTPLELVEVDVEGPRPHEVVVRLASSGICHTDLGVIAVSCRRASADRSRARGRRCHRARG